MICTEFRRIAVKELKKVSQKFLSGLQLALPVCMRFPHILGLNLRVLALRERVVDSSRISYI